MKRPSLAGPVAAVLVALASPAGGVPVFIGTQAGGGSPGKGIYQMEFNPGTGAMTVPKLAAEYDNPGFLVLHPRKPVLLAVGRPSKPFDDRTDSVAAFAVGADHSLRFLGEASSGGTGACHLAVDPSGRAVVVANYGDGGIAALPLDGQGVPGPPLWSVRNMGSGPNAARQEGTHAHGVYFDPAGRQLLVPDLGLDRVHVYRVSAGLPDFPESMEPLRSKPGAGPRHMAFSPDGEHAYVINELDSTVLTASFKDGRFTPGAVVSTLPEGYSGQNTTAEIEVSADGRFVYASNRGHDSIAVFSRDVRSGKLSTVQHAPCGGKTPRHFKISPDGKWLLCAHLGSGSIAALAVDLATGRLSPPVSTVPSPSPICLLFGR